MNSWPLGVKIGTGVVALLLVLVLWIGLRRAPDTPLRPIRSVQRSARVQDRLERLRQEWGLRGERDPVTGEFRASQPPRGRLVERSAQPPPADIPSQPPLFEEEPDFESLKHLAISDPDPDKRVAAVLLLGTSENPEAVPVLAQALGDKDPDVRMTAIDALGDIGGAEPAEAIQAALDDADPEMRFEALGVLADMGGEAARAAVEKALNDDDEDVRALAEGVLDLEDMYQNAPAEAGDGAAPERDQQ